MDQIGNFIKSCHTPQYQNEKKKLLPYQEYQFIDNIGKFIKHLRPSPQKNNEQNNPKNITYTRTKLLELNKTNSNKNIPSIISTKLRKIGIFKNNALKSS